MTGNDHFEKPEEVFTEGAFEPLSSDVRRKIIRTAERTFPGVDTISFSELLEIGPLDDPGHLRYHVKELEGTLLVDIGGEYRPMFGTIREAIGYNAAKSGVDPPFRACVLTSYRCPHCPELLDVGYSNAERLFFHCPRHGLVFDQDLAPSVSSDDPTDWIDFGNQTRHFDLERLDIGFCPRCNGRVEGTLVREGLTYSSRIESKSDERVLWADFRCQACKYEFQYPAATRAMTNDRVRRVFTEHGIDVRT